MVGLFESSVTILSFVVLGSAPQSIKRCMIPGAVGQMFSSRLNSFYTGNQYSSEPRDESFKSGGCLVLPENLAGETNVQSQNSFADRYIFIAFYFVSSFFVSFEYNRLFIFKCSSVPTVYILTPKS